MYINSEIFVLFDLRQLYKVPPFFPPLYANDLFHCVYQLITQIHKRKIIICWPDSYRVVSSQMSKAPGDFKSRRENTKRADVNHRHFFIRVATRTQFSFFFSNVKRKTIILSNLSNRKWH